MTTDEMTTDEMNAPDAWVRDKIQHLTHEADSDIEVAECFSKTAAQRRQNAERIRLRIAEFETLLADRQRDEIARRKKKDIRVGVTIVRVNSMVNCAVCKKLLTGLCHRIDTVTSNFDAKANPHGFIAHSGCFTTLMEATECDFDEV